MGVLGALVHYGFIVQGDGRIWGNEFRCDTQAHQFCPVGGLWAMDTRDELERTTRDSHARPWTPMGIIIHRLYNQFASIAMPFPIRWRQTPGVDFKP